MPLSPFVIFLATHLILAPTFSAAIPGFGSGVPAADLVQGRQAADETLVSSSFPARLPPPPPGPLAFKGTKLVDDPAHPWKPLRKGDQRGPCPALNVLASHGVFIQFRFDRIAELTIRISSTSLATELQRQLS